MLAVTVAKSLCDNCICKIIQLYVHKITCIIYQMLVTGRNADIERTFGFMQEFLQNPHHHNDLVSHRHISTCMHMIVLTEPEEVHCTCNSVAAHTCTNMHSTVYTHCCNT